MAGGGRYSGRPGDTVDVSDIHARQIRTSFYGLAGIMSASRYAVGTKTGRWCRACTPARLWNVWTRQCPRCGTNTIEEVR